MPGDKRVVVVTRTFSKLHGLAGLRIGYLAGPRDVVATLRKVRPPFSVNAIAQSAALAALADRDHRARVREQTLAARTTTAAMFEEAGYQTVPSQANFILVRTPDPGNLADALAVHGVSVRPGQALGVPGAVRPGQHPLAVRPGPAQAGPDRHRRTSGNGRYS